MIRGVLAVERTEGCDGRWWILAVLCLSLLVMGIDNRILNVALPTLSRPLHATNSQLQWIVDAYVLVFASLLLTTGSLSDRFGRRSALACGLVIFGVGSVSSAFAGTANVLTATRALMGIGGAPLLPPPPPPPPGIFSPPGGGAAPAPRARGP